MEQATKELDQIFEWQQVLTEHQDPLLVLNAFPEDERKRIMHRFEQEILIPELSSAKFSTVYFKALKGDAEAQFQIADSLTSYDDECLKWLNKSANQGYAPAQCELGQYYMDNSDDPLGLEWLKKAADQNYCDAQFELGDYWSGCKNNFRAIEYYLKAASQNEPVAMNNMGNIYYEKQDYKTAIAWYIKSFNIDTDQKNKGISALNISNAYHELLDENMSKYWKSIAITNGYVE